MEIKRRRKWIAVVLTFFSIGLGHVYSGRVKRGIMFFAVVNMFFLLAMCLLLLPITPLNMVFTLLLMVAIYVCCIVDVIRITAPLQEYYEVKKYNKWYCYILYVLVFNMIIQPILVAPLKANLVQAYKMPSGSMSPTLMRGDNFIVNNLIYKYSSPERGDLVVFPSPKKPSSDFIKRVVGLSGETLEIKDKQLYIDGRIYTEPYVVKNDDTILSKDISPRDNLGPVRIPDDSVFVMGDNRDMSHDSRFFGCVKKANVTGKVLYIYWSWDKGENSIRWDRVGASFQ